MRNWRGNPWSPAMHVSDRLSLEQLESIASQAADKNRFRRIRAVILAIRGRTASEIAEALGGRRRTVQ